VSILIVDDAAIQRLALASILKAEGYTELLMAQSAEEGYRRLEAPQADIDLILMDINMPGTNGIEACRYIKASEAWREIPIIMVTSSTVAEDLQQAFNAGAMDYITKPPLKAELLARVRSALKLKQEMDRRQAREQELLQVNEQMTELNEQLSHAFADLVAEQAKSERLLLNILPEPIAKRLKQQEQTLIADTFPEVTVLFADIVEFTQLSARISAEALIALLNEVFSACDELAEKHGLEKIKTIGDAYMAVAGLPTPRADHTEAAARMALDIRALFLRRTTATGSLIQIRIGMHSGPVVAGVIGTKKFIYDLWGDTVNIASRMEALGVPGAIQVTPEAYQRLKHLYAFEEQPPIPVKGRGEMTTYLLLGPK
jgi:class 3 adenylate cyclase/CheY-like chemotaxis protein